MAVVESELEILSNALEKVVAKNMSPDLTILKMIETHLDAIKMVVLRNGTMRAGFFRDIWRVERVRRNFDVREIKLFKQILSDGKEKGIFEIDNVDVMADILHYCIQTIFINNQICKSNICTFRCKLQRNSLTNATSSTSHDCGLTC